MIVVATIALPHVVLKLTLTYLMSYLTSYLILHLTLHLTLPYTFLYLTFGHTLHLTILLLKLQGWSDKYLASPPDSVTIARRVYYCVEPSCRPLTSKFQSNRICGFVLTPCRSERVRGF